MLCGLHSHPSSVSVDLPVHMMIVLVQPIRRDLAQSGSPYDIMDRF